MKENVILGLTVDFHFLYGKINVLFLIKLLTVAT